MRTQGEMTIPTDRIISSTADIPILGYYDHRNAGDEAFKLAFDLAFAGTRHHFVQKFERGQKIPLAAFGGGAVINDYFLRRLENVDRIHMIGCSLPYGDGDARLLEPMRDRIGGLYLRSNADVAAARELGFDARFTPDIVFSVPPRRSATLDDLVAAAALPPKGFSPERKKLFVFLSDHYSLVPGADNETRFHEIEHFKTQIAAALDQVANRFDIVMPSMSVWYNARDYIFAAEVLRRMKNAARVCLVEKYFEPQALIDIIASTECAIVSMKYHGLVFGLLNRKFVINIGSTRKTLDLMTDAGITALSVSERSMTTTQLLDVMQKHKSENLLKRISDVAENWRGQAVAALREAAAKVKADL